MSARPFLTSKHCSSLLRLLFVHVFVFVFVVVYMLKTVYSRTAVYTVEGLVSNSGCYCRVVAVKWTRSPLPCRPMI